MEPDRLNSPTTFEMPLEVLGHELQFSQDPNSKHLGTTVWDASLVFVKFLERNCRKGRFSPAKLKGKRVIELGAGCGVSGVGMALLGCDVVVTDQKEVLPLLQRNVERNISRIMQKNPESFGSIQVSELQWGDESHIKAVGPPFDYIIGTDVSIYWSLCCRQYLLYLDLGLQLCWATRSVPLVSMRRCLKCGKETLILRLSQNPRWMKHFNIQVFNSSLWDSKIQQSAQRAQVRQVLKRLMLKLVWRIKTMRKMLW
ncbi:protein-lysine methyltransferase METTL21D isoform X2 [Abrus precatorius]|uniref:Protein-lysine methyltransferase METTL21D isoform X2 n=1 Tax=Abrus precatorius TaxID=3816 RepID=A0A8B8KTT4_ABRPR|nr:protein-lysine methyltransferase METTL21D isoform X2 [Abrus precatorius]